MPYQPINFGNAMLQGEQINALRAQNDPNSLKNQLLQAQIGATRAKANNPNPGKYGLNPFLVREPQSGEIKAFQMYSGGGMAEVPMPEGFGPATKGTWKDTGGGLQFFEPYGPANPAPTGGTSIPAVPSGPLSEDPIYKYPEGVQPPIRPDAIEIAPESMKPPGLQTPPGFVPKTLPPEKTPEYIRGAEKIKQEEATAGALDRKKNEMLGASAAKKAEAGFAIVDKINTNIFNLEKGLAALESGAESGPISQYLPTVRAASVELNNARSRLGLDVVGAVTFGALSKGELTLALDVAMPTGLNEPELKQWITDKVAAQRKLAGYINEQSIFLSQPGNTEAMWAELVKAGKAVDPRTAEPDNAVNWSDL